MFPFEREHMMELQMNGETDVESKQREQFLKWFKKWVNHAYYAKSSSISEELCPLANGPLQPEARIYSACTVNGVHYCTFERDNRHKLQNSGIIVEGYHLKDKIDYYGRLSSVVEFSYILGCKVVLFKCEWFNTTTRAGITVGAHFTFINTKNQWYEEGPFVLVSQARQVKDIKLGPPWQIVQCCHHRHI